MCIIITTYRCNAEIESIAAHFTREMRCCESHIAYGCKGRAPDWCVNNSFDCSYMTTAIDYLSIFCRSIDHYARLNVITQMRNRWQSYNTLAADWFAFQVHGFINHQSIGMQCVVWICINCWFIEVQDYYSLNEIIFVTFYLNDSQNKLLQQKEFLITNQSN